jgi:hypothetical protein
MKSLLICVALLVAPRCLAASFTDNEIKAHRARIIESGAESVLKQYDQRAYLFQISDDEKTVDVLVLFGSFSAENYEADVFLSERLKSTDGSKPRRVAWTKMPSHEVSRLLYVVEHSDVLSLGKRVNDDPLRVLVLTGETIFRLVAKSSGRSITVERTSGDSLPLDHVFGFVNSSIVRRLSVREH